MKSNSFVSDSLLGGEQMQTLSASMPAGSFSPMSGAAERHSFDNRGGKESEDLRSSVADRFMSMLEEHDRARMRVLTASEPER